MIYIRKEKCPSDTKFFVCDSCEDIIGKDNTMNWIHFGDNHHQGNLTLILCDKCFKELGEKICQNKNM